VVNEKELKDLTQEELIEKCVVLQGELKDARHERDIHKRMYDRLYKKVRTIQNIIEL
jgi:ribosomal protein L19E